MHALPVLLMSISSSTRVACSRIQHPNFELVLLFSWNLFLGKWGSGMSAEAACDRYSTRPIRMPHTLQISNLHLLQSAAAHHRWSHIPRFLASTVLCFGPWVSHTDNRSLPLLSSRKPILATDSSRFWPLHCQLSGNSPKYIPMNCTFWPLHLCRHVALPQVSPSVMQRYFAFLLFAAALQARSAQLLVARAASIAHANPAERWLIGESNSYITLG